MKAALTVALTVAGVALIGLGVSGIVTDVGAGGWVAGVAGAAVLHDGVLVPVVLAVGVATARVPGGYRGIVRSALVVAGFVTLVAFPLVLGKGRRADEPSRLPLPYDRNLAIVLGVIAAVAAGAAALRAVRHRRGRR